jgi:nitrite reductase/ring-hydroxylating ferredoxin subunit
VRARPSYDRPVGVLAGAKECDVQKDKLFEQLRFSEMVSDGRDEFRVSTAAYRSEDVFRAEMSRIFESTWIYLCHESEIAQPGDFRSTLLGLQPVIVTRDQAGAVHGFFNVCPHRGSALTRQEQGNTRAFVCPYHGWAFRPNGKLIAVSDPSRFPPGFAEQGKDLVPVPRIASYGGLVFGSLNPEVPSLEEHLGGARRHIDLWLKRQAGGTFRVCTPHKYAYAGNWKLQSENVYDGYHPGFVHRSAFNTIRKFEGAFQNRFYGPVRPSGATRGYAEGHGSLEAGAPLESAGVDPAIRAAYELEITRLHGEATAREVINNRQFLVFPNLAIFDFNIRVIQPRAQDRTEICSYPVVIDGVDDQINTNRMLDAQTRVGTAGMLSADDVDVFAGGQHALSGTGLPWITLTRGLGMEQLGADLELVGAYSDEVPQRAFWRRWQALMTADTGGSEVSL